MKKIRIYIYVLLISTAYIAAQGLKAGKVTGSIKLDGDLSETDWKAAQESSTFTKLKSKEDGSAATKTWFKIISDENNIYVGVYCADDKMSELKANPAERDGMDIFGQDEIEFFCNPEGSGTRYFQFAVSAANDHYDVFLDEQGKVTLGHYSTKWESAVFKGDNFWSVEIKIPLAAFYPLASTSFSGIWKCNVTRGRPFSKEFLTWSPCERRFHESDKFLPVANMPKKKADQDFGIMGTDFQTYSGKPGEYTGTLFLKYRASKAAAGKYFFTIKDTASGKILCPKKEIAVAGGEGFLEAGKAVFQATGTPRIDIVIESAERVHLEQTQVVRVEYDPLSIDIHEPNFGKGIFPGQDVKRFKGIVRMKLSPENMSQAQVEIILSGPGLTVKPLRLPAASSVPFEFAAVPAEVGVYTINAFLRIGKKELASCSNSLSRVKDSKGPNIYFDANQNIVLNGKPQIIRGILGPDYLVSQELKDNYPGKPYSPTINLFENWINIECERLAPAEKASMKRDNEPSANMYATMKNIIEKNLENPDLHFYYLADEPELRDISPVYLRYQYEYIKKLDPRRPVLMISREPEKFTRCADVIAVHPYISPNVGQDGSRKLMNKMQEIRRQILNITASSEGKIIPWLCAQGFSYRAHDRYADSPNFEEFTCQFFSALANGCKGFIPFFYAGHFHSQDVRDGLPYVYESIIRLEEFFLSPEKTLPVVNLKNEELLDCFVKKTDGKILVICVNLSPDKVTKTFDCPGLRNTKELNSFRGSSDLKINDGKFTVNFERYSTHIFTYPKMDAGLKREAAVTKGINDQKADWRNSGNLLYGMGAGDIVYDVSDTYTSADVVPLPTLNDGIKDALGWRDVLRKNPARIEIMFPADAIFFKRVRIWTSTVQTMELYAWKFGEWKPLGQKEASDKKYFEFILDEEMSTVKLKILMPKTKNNLPAEVYEIEVFKK